MINHIELIGKIREVEINREFAVYNMSVRDKAVSETSGKTISDVSYFGFVDSDVEKAKGFTKGDVLKVEGYLDSRSEPYVSEKGDAKHVYVQDIKPNRIEKQAENSVQRASYSISGRLGKDPEIMEKDGNRFAVYSVAVKETAIADSGRKLEHTTWVSFVSSDVEKAKTMKSGEAITTQGHLYRRSMPVQTKQGEKKYGSVALSPREIRPMTAIEQQKMLQKPGKSKSPFDKYRQAAQATKKPQKSNVMKK